MEVGRNYGPRQPNQCTSMVNHGHRDRRYTLDSHGGPIWRQRSTWRERALGRLCGARHLATRTDPLNGGRQDRSMGRRRGHGSRGRENLALAVEQNYDKNAALVAHRFRIQTAAAMCFGLAVIMLAIRVIGDCACPGTTHPPEHPRHAISEAIPVAAVLINSTLGSQ